MSDQPHVFRRRRVNASSFAVSKAPKVNVGLLHALADLRAQVLDGLMLSDVNQDILPRVLNPVSSEL